MKKIILVSVLVLTVFYILKQFVYKPYMWEKAINSPEQKLQLGSFIFSKHSGINGSQSFENYYSIFKVIEINGDFVRLSVVRQLSDKNNFLGPNFSTTKETYRNLKENIQNLTITRILLEDLYKGDSEQYTINNYLLSKYPDLKKSRYYYADIPERQKNTAIPTDPNDLFTYFEFVYSKEKIIKNAELASYGLNNFNELELSGSSENIELILN